MDTNPAAPTSHMRHAYEAGASPIMPVLAKQQPALTPSVDFSGYVQLIRRPAKVQSADPLPRPTKHHILEARSEGFPCWRFRGCPRYIVFHPKRPDCKPNYKSTPLECKKISKTQPPLITDASRSLGRRCIFVDEITSIFEPNYNKPTTALTTCCTQRSSPLYVCS